MKAVKMRYGFTTMLRDRQKELLISDEGWDGRFVGHLLHEESHSRRRTDIPNIARPLLIHFNRFSPALTAADDPIGTG